MVVRLRRVQRRERLHRLALGQATTRRICVAEKGKSDDGTEWPAVFISNEMFYFLNSS